jgi:hypothetical protein
MNDQRHILLHSLNRLSAPLLKSLAGILVLSVCLAYAQGLTALFNGSVTDPSGSAVPGADVTLTNPETNQIVRTTTNDKGEYSFPSTNSGTYRVTVTKTGFKTQVKQGLTMAAGVNLTVNIELEIGQTTETIIVEGGAELVQTTSAEVSATITGRQINELPTATRNGMEVFTQLPGVSVTTSFRESYINGLPKESVNITIDGMNTNDNWLKSQDGFFSFIMPSVDSLEEVTMSTSAAGVDSTSEGGAQLKFVTKSGTNSYHGGVFWQHRNTFFNSNYYFNNINGLPRDLIKLNQGGFHAGGPVKKNKLFFFVNYEIYRLPSSSTFSRTVLPPTGSTGANTWAGNYTYKQTNGNINTVNLFTLAAQANASRPAGVRAYGTSTDSIVAQTLSQIWTLAQPGNLKSLVASNSDYNRLSYSEQPSSMSTRGFWTGKIDYNMTEKHHISFSMNYDLYTSVPDLLNSTYPVFPGTGTVLGSNINAGQRSRRFEGTVALRSTLSARLTNELRFGATGGTVLFTDGVSSPTAFSEWKGFNPVFNYISGVVATLNSNGSSSRRNAPVKTLSETLSWVKGSHQFTFGGTWNSVSTWQQSFGTETIPNMTFGLAANDPVNNGSTAWLTSANLPGISSADLTTAGSMYAFLTGRVSSLTSQVAENEATHQYGHNPAVDRNRMRVYGGFAQDTWRLTPTLTATIGMRVEYQAPFENVNGTYSYVGLDGIWGVSGVGHMFQPGVLTGVQPTFKAITGHASYNAPAQYLPSLGLAWQLPAASGFMRIFTGQHSGAAVLRAGYSISSTRPGGYSFQSMYGSNKGLFYSTSVDPSNFPQYFGAPGSVALSDSSFPSQPAPASPQFPISPSFTDSLNDFDPNLHVGYVQSWNLGYQRELSRNTVVEVRFVGNHGLHEWRQVNLNETNIFENGFLTEEMHAQTNLAIANGVTQQQLIYLPSLKTTNYGNQGLPGQVAVPVLQAALGGTCCNDTTTANNLAHNSLGSVATSISTNLTRLNALIASGKPANYFQVNPAVGSGGSWLMNNTGSSFFDSLQVDLRRHLAKGLQLQGSYVFAKALVNGAINSSGNASQPTTFRDLNLDKQSPTYDIRHALKANWIWEVPVGSARTYLSSVHNPVLRKAIEGWEFVGTTRIQSGQPTRLTSGRGTINGQESGVVLHNISLKQLQDQVGVYKTTGSNGVGILYDMPLSIIQNTQAAYNSVSGLTFDPAAPYIGWQTTPGEIGYYEYLRAPWQKHLDISVIKRTKIRESINCEFRAQALNVMNITNFYLGGAAISSSAFGQITSAFRDTNNAVDPGGRILEFVARINF